MKIMFKIKEFLWNCGLIDNSRCPRCGEKLTEFGYSEFGHYYRCDICGWGKDK